MPLSASHSHPRGVMEHRRLQQLAKAVAGGDYDGITSLFLRQDASAPAIAWNPGAANLPTKELPVLMHYWDGLLGNRLVPLAAEIDPNDFRDALGYVMLLDVLDGGGDYRYRVYGTKIADCASFDMTGKRTSEIPISPHIRAFFLAIYRAVLLRGEPVFTMHSPPPQIAVTTWSRLVLPLGDGAGKIVRLLVGNVPGPWRRPLSTPDRMREPNQNCRAS